jgi:hypothetical protein
VAANTSRMPTKVEDIITCREKRKRQDVRRVLCAVGQINVGKEVKRLRRNMYSGKVVGPERACIRCGVERFETKRNHG